MKAEVSKTFIITSWAPPMIGGPQNLYNLFSQFPPESYTVFTSYQALLASGVRKSNWLAGDYVFFDHAGIVPKDTDIAAGATDSHQKQTRSWQHRLYLLLQRLPGFSMIWYWLLGPLKIVLMWQKGIRPIRKNKPSLLLGISDNGPALIATYLLSLTTRIPCAYYLYDIYRGNNLLPFDRLLAFLFERRIFTKARLVIVTNEATELYYRERYGNRIRISVVHNSVFAEQYERQRTLFTPKKPYTILFTGHVYWAQEQSVLNVIKAMNAIKDLNVRLDLYVPKASETITHAIRGKKNIRLLEASQSDMPKIQSGATLLYLPLAWHTKSPDIIRTATPGKFTDYLAAGRPMLVHAPDYAYVSSYSKQHRLGLVVDQDNPTFLAKTIRQFLENPERGRAYIENGLKIFYQNHDATKNAKKLMQLLHTATKTRGAKSKI